MGFKKIDQRIRTLIDNGAITFHRSLFIIVGERAQDQVAILYNILVKSQIKARPTVLWCYKNELSFTGNREKRLKRLKRKLSHGSNTESNNIFDTFVCSSNIRFTYYKDSKRILGNTFGMLVLQDFEALTPNIMARTIETVEGGGIICLLLSSIQSLRQLYTMSMDVHSRYRTSGYNEIVCRFNERLLLSLNQCKNCLVLDDNLNILPVFTQNLIIESCPKRSSDDLSQAELELKKVKDCFADVQPIGSLTTLCKTLCQAKVLCKSFDYVSKPGSCSVIAITAARGRGKSAMLGLIISGAISLGMSNIYVVAPSPENLVTFFEFVIKGLEKLGYTEKSDYEITKSQCDNQKLITCIKVTKTHRQNIQYLAPSMYDSAYNAELIVCDEAAAIPLPLVKKLLGPHLLFISSTVNGYEGTGRSLSLKLIKELRVGTFSSKQNRLNIQHTLSENTLIESIRYADHDPIESWLNRLLCMEELTAQKIEPTLLSSPKDCSLFYVNRDTLFSYHKAAEIFLQKLTSLFISSHYKNSPNDLQTMADAPAHHIFVLLPKSTKNTIPDILCAIQVCFEGGLSEDVLKDHLARGQRGDYGDLIPWVVSQQFCEVNFGRLKGVRIVRLVTHPDYVSMGYGSRAMELLADYFNKTEPSKIDVMTKNSDFISQSEEIEVMDEQIVPKTLLPPLLVDVNDRVAESVSYIGVSYGLTPQLLKFWKRLKFIPIYVRQTPNELTGEHTTIMIKVLTPLNNHSQPNWIEDYYKDFRSRFLSLLSYSFKDISPALALSLINHDQITIPFSEITPEELKHKFTPHDLKRINNYSKNTSELSFIMDLIPRISELWLTNRIKDSSITWSQLAVILALGLQHRSLKSIERELDLPENQVLTMFNKIIKKTMTYIDSIQEQNLDLASITHDPHQTWSSDLKLNQIVNSISIPK